MTLLVLIAKSDFIVRSPSHKACAATVNCVDVENAPEAVVSLADCAADRFGLGMAEAATVEETMFWSSLSVFIRQLKAVARECLPN